jgi:hypothetical protein
MKYLLVVLVCLVTQFASAFVGTMTTTAEEPTPAVPPQTVTLSVGPKFTQTAYGKLEAKILCNDLQALNESYTRDGVMTIAMNDCRASGCQYCAVLSISVTDSKCDRYTTPVAFATGKAVIQGFNCLP